MVDYRGMAIPLRRETLLLTLLLLAAGVALWTPLDRAAEMRISPDSIEQVAGAMKLARGESFTICPDGLELPPRYPPWFGWLLAPVFLLGEHPGLAVLPVFLCALACVFMTYRLGRAIGGSEAGLAAGALLLALPMFRFWSAEIMTDVPATAAALWAMLGLLRLADPEEPEDACNPLRCGLVMTAAFLLRPALGVLGIAAAVLLLRRHGLRDGLPRLLWMAAPAVLAGLAMLLWNLGAYGDPFRSGYRYWVSAIYDHPEIVFPVGAFGRNLGNLMDTHWPSLLGLALLLLPLQARFGAPEGRRARGQRGLRLAILVVAIALPYLWLHLRYYSGRPRYFLPLFPPVIALAAGLGLPLLRERARIVGTLAVTAALALALVLRWQESRVAAPQRYLSVRALSETTPEDALLLTALPPDYLRAAAPDLGGREIRLLSRDEEYASKSITVEIEGRLVSRPAVGRVASEDVVGILAELRAGRPVFVLHADLWRAGSLRFLESLEDRVLVEPVGPALSRLRLR